MADGGKARLGSEQSRVEAVRAGGALTGAGQQKWSLSLFGFFSI